MVGNWTNMYAKFHHIPRLQGIMVVLVFHGMTCYILLVCILVYL